MFSYAFFSILRFSSFFKYVLHHNQLVLQIIYYIVSNYLQSFTTKKKVSLRILHLNFHSLCNRTTMGFVLFPLTFFLDYFPVLFVYFSHFRKELMTRFNAFFNISIDPPFRFNHERVIQSSSSPFGVKEIEWNGAIFLFFVKRKETWRRKKFTQQSIEMRRKMIDFFFLHRRHWLSFLI